MGFEWKGAIHAFASRWLHFVGNGVLLLLLGLVWGFGLGPVGRRVAMAVGLSLKALGLGLRVWGLDWM